MSIRQIPVLLIICCQLLAVPVMLEKDHLLLTRPVAYSTIGQFLNSVADRDFIDVSSAGHSVEGRKLYLVHLNQGGPARWTMFFYGQQHGNEPAGKDALLYLIQRIAENPRLLPKGVDLWIMPMVNPDGAQKDMRQNANGVDLNRDHILVREPETQILHQVFDRIQPDLTVDCHEFTRDSRDYLELGWIEWPQIMMDCANNPLFNAELYTAGVDWCNRVARPLAKKGYNYTRYYVGGPPEKGEMRYSFPEIGDARNYFGARGCLSFIVESGVFRSAENPQADLGVRVDAYLTILETFLQEGRYRRKETRLIRTARTAALPDFIPTNYFWANAQPRITPVKVLDKTSGKPVSIPIADFMHDLVIKSSVPTPAGYIILPEAAAAYAPLLKRHSIHYKPVTIPITGRSEACRLLRIEDHFDPIYMRYSGRQIVQRDSVKIATVPTGSLYISLDQPNPRLAALILEPTMMYGLFQHTQFQDLVDTETQRMPIIRWLEQNKEDIH